MKTRLAPVGISKICEKKEFVPEFTCETMPEIRLCSQAKNLPTVVFLGACSFFVSSTDMNESKAHANPEANTTSMESLVKTPDC